MDLLARSLRIPLGFAKLRSFARRLMHDHEEAEALRRILDGCDDHLLIDAGIDRNEAHHSLGEAPFFPGREWDRCQL